jgi:hypothetical protein
MMGRSPAKPTPWRALAEQLVDEGCESIYLTRLRAQHDVRAHVDTLAEEVAEEMARALGRTTSRVDYAFACLERDRQRASEAAADVLKLRVPELRDELRRHGLAVGGNKPDLRARLMPVATADAVEAFDAQRAICRKERQNLLIHRQALGFKTGNHGAVEKYYPSSSLKPLGDFLDGDGSEDDDEPPVTTEQSYKGKNWGGFRFY